MKPFKTTLFTLSMLVFFIGCEPQTEETSPAVQEAAGDTLYDAELASRFGADDYGMKRYVVAFLKSGSNRDHDQAQAQEIQAGHMAHIQKMAEDGKLVVAGPFLDGGEIRGIFVFDTTLEEAEALTAADPAVRSGRLVMELHPWYGSAALMQVGETHRRLAKENP